MKQERRGFLRSLGLLSFAAAMSKFLFGKKNNTIESGTFSKECISEKDLQIDKNYILENNITDEEDKVAVFSDTSISVVSGHKIKQYHSCIIEDEYGVVHLYITNNIDEPAHYIKESGEDSFKFKEIAFKNIDPIC